MRKIAAHYLFPITGTPIKNGMITLSDEGEILSIGTFSSGEEESLEFYNGILCPGFVNAHCHLELSFLLGTVPQHTGLFGFIRRMTEREKGNTDELLVAALKADTEMAAEGVVAVGDISNTAASLDIKASSPVFYHNFIEVFGNDSGMADRMFNEGVALTAKADLRGLTTSITPHAPYSMSDKLFNMVVDEASKSDILSIHNQECLDESEYFIAGSGMFADFYAKSGFEGPAVTGKSSVHRILDALKDELRLLLIHNIYTSEADYDAVMAKNRNTAWVLCPNSNLYIENQLPPIDMLRRKGANIAIGTDSLSSNTRLSMVEELKTIGSQFPDISMEELLTWATLGGARALGIDGQFGSLEVGKKPGVVLVEGVDFDTMQLKPLARASILSR